MINTKKYTVRENTNLYRDGHSKAIINNDLGALRDHQQKTKINNSVLDNNMKISRLEDDISEIKKLLNLLINK